MLSAESLYSSALFIRIGMLISEKVSLHRIIERTSRLFFLDVIICSLTFVIFYFSGLSDFDLPAIVPTILGTALAFFIGFNNNQAYDRWWEARKIWGELVNNSRSWARYLIYFSNTKKESKNDNHAQATHMVRRHLAFVYTLKAKLRNEGNNSFEQFLNKDDLQNIKNESNKPNAILSLQARDMNELYEKNSIDGFQLRILVNILNGFTDDMGKSERIKNTVFPTAYYFYTRVFIWIFIVLITLDMSEVFGVWSIAIGTVIGYIYLVSHQLGKSLVDPFEHLPSGIPLDQITRTIEINLLEALDEENIPKPVEAINNEYIM